MASIVSGSHKIGKFQLELADFSFSQLFRPVWLRCYLPHLVGDVSVDIQHCGSGDVAQDGRHGLSRPADDIGIVFANISIDILTNYFTFIMIML